MKISNFKGFVISTVFVIFLAACGSSGGDEPSGTGATLTGTVTSFTATASVTTKQETLLASIKNFFLRIVHAQVSGVVVSMDELSTTTDANGRFTLNDIPIGGDFVTFTQGSSSAQYLLNDIVRDETFTLNGIEINGSVVSTEHSGTWEGTITSSEIGTLDMTLTLAAGSNAFSGEGYNDIGDLWAIQGTENGTSMAGIASVTGGPCFGDEATFLGSFTSDTISGTYDSPGGVCNASNGSFTLTKVSGP